MRLLASVCLAVVAFAACASAVEFSITDFTDKSLWDVYSQGGLTQGANPTELLLLQPGDLMRTNGYKRTITLGGDTVQVSTFTVRIDNDGADGFYYLLAAASGNTNVFANSVGIFIDTYKNAGPDFEQELHFIAYDGAGSGTLVGEVNIESFNLEDGNAHTIEVTFDSTTFGVSVKIDGSAAGSHTFTSAEFARAHDSQNQAYPYFSSWHGDVNQTVYLTAYSTVASKATCVNNELVELPNPTQVAPSLSGNNYAVGLNIDSSFEAAYIRFGNGGTPCDLTSSVNNNWIVNQYTSGCNDLYSFERPAQNMIASCGFTKDGSLNPGYQTFVQSLTVETHQRRTIPHWESRRNVTYTEKKHTAFGLRIRVPDTVSANYTVDVFFVPNNDGRPLGVVLSAIQNIDIDADTSPHFTLTLEVLTSSAHPYELDYTGGNSGADLGDITDGGSTTCSGTDVCVQTHTISMPITKTCSENKDALADAISLNFTLGCKSDFTGSCATPSPPIVLLEFTLVSSKYCPIATSTTLTATLDTYRNVDINSATDWDVADKSSQFVVGSTIYGLVDISVADSVATVDSATLTGLKTHGAGGAVVNVFGTSEVTVVNTGYTSAAHTSRFSILLVNGVSVALDQDIEVGQAVSIEATTEVTFTTSAKDTNPVLASMAADNSRKSRRVITVSESDLSGATATVVISTTPGATQQPAAGSSSSTVAGMSTMTVAAVGGAVALLVIAVAYKHGQRAELDSDEEPMNKLAKSASTVELTADSTSADSTADEMEQSV